MGTYTGRPRVIFSLPPGAPRLEGYENQQSVSSNAMRNPFSKSVSVCLHFNPLICHLCHPHPSPPSPPPPFIFSRTNALPLPRPLHQSSTHPPRLAHPKPLSLTSTVLASHRRISKEKYNIRDLSHYSYVESCSGRSKMCFVAVVVELLALSMSRKVKFCVSRQDFGGNPNRLSERTNNLMKIHHRHQLIDFTLFF